MTRIITWNVAGRRAKVPQQLSYLVERSPDIVALQEVRPSTGKLLMDGLAEKLGLRFGNWSLEAIEGPLSPRRSLGVLIASRFPYVGEARRPLRPPWSEKALSLCFDCPFGSLDVHSIHVPPGSSNGWVKIETLESVIDAMSIRHEHPVIVAGDFNAPQAELPSGELVTWAQRKRPDGSFVLRKRIRGGPGERWDLAERGVLRGLSQYGVEDVYRAAHGHGAVDGSWIYRRGGKEWPRRFDHILASEHVGPRGVRYLHEARKAELSDHSPLELDFGIA
jgi:exonuclease III